MYWNCSLAKNNLRNNKKHTSLWLQRGPWLWTRKRIRKGIPLRWNIWCNNRSASSSINGRTMDMRLPYGGIKGSTSPIVRDQSRLIIWGKGIRWLSKRGVAIRLVMSLWWLTPKIIGEWPYKWWATKRDHITLLAPCGIPLDDQNEKIQDMEHQE